MTFHNAKVRKFPPAAMWKPIRVLYSEQSRALETVEQIIAWQETQKPLWDRVCYNLREMESGGILGTIRIFSSVEFHEDLSMDGDPFLGLAGSMLSQPIIEDLMTLGGLHDVIESFFLTRYGIAPRISRKEGRIVSVSLPGFFQRLVLGYPSPRKVQKDFKKLSQDLWSLGFETRITGNVILFGVFLPEYDNEGIDEDYVRVAVDLLNLATRGGIAYD